MKAINVNDVLKILHEYGMFIFVTDQKKYSEMVDKIANLPSVTPQEPILDRVRAEIIELRSKQNVGVLECLDIIDKYKAESEE